MLKVVGCFVEAHDHRLVLLAALVCAVSAFTAVELLCHARTAPARPRAAWLSVAAVAGGSGIWSTHFIAMLAFAPGLPSAYAMMPTVLSLLFAIVLTGLGMALAASVRSVVAPIAGGALVGGGIAAMHYTGMSAFMVPGRLTWDPALVAASIAIGAALGAAALCVAVRASTLKGQIAGAVLLLLAIVGHHFTAMGAVLIEPDPLISIPDQALPTSWLAVAVALGSLAVLLLAAAALALDIRERRHALQEGERLRSLANAAVEGLIVCRGDTIVSANRSFGELVGLPDGTGLTGKALSGFLDMEIRAPARSGSGDLSSETEIRRADGSVVPVEIIVRAIEYARQPHFAIAVRDLRARRKAERQIHFLAHHDALTGLPNRTTFNIRLDGEMRAADAAGRKLAVLFLDLDRFKEVNDLFGHAAGDEILESVGKVVTGLLSESQLIARLGGDEFALLVPCEHGVAAGRLSESILDALRAETRTAGPAVAASIGIAIYPDDASDRSTLLSYADTALYRAKSEGRCTYRFYESSMGAEVRKRRLLEHELRHAIARGELSLVYQPQTEIRTGQVCGFEALLRWHHPERGSISPATFVPVAEETGLITQIGEWVLRESCREAARWSSNLTVAVNVSAVQIHGPSFVDLVGEVLAETGLSPERLELEITETALIRDPTRALQTLTRLKNIGVKIAMDDFGTGYSSLSNLRSFPFDKIKIDKSFISSVHASSQAAAIVESVLVLGEGLNVAVLAEGVETPEELRFLAERRCHGAQGYLIGRPSQIAQYSGLTRTEAGEAAAALAEAA